MPHDLIASRVETAKPLGPLETPPPAESRWHGAAPEPRPGTKDSSRSEKAPIYPVDSDYQKNARERAAALAG
ncbi:hypothetical protein X772_32245 [Mesorhizobium sp. LSJC280B00]|nr:hypothetical protein X772_32245 [Mesorhizobium sp. LSJC280B00]